MRWNIQSWALLILTSTGLAFWLGSVRAAGVPETGTLVYAGVLQDSTGLPTGTRPIAVELYGADAGGVALCRVAQDMAQVTSGRFRIPLDTDPRCLAAVRANPDLWVDVQVDGHSIGRSKLAAVPYAVEAKRASEAAGALAEQVVPPGAVMAFDLAACPPGWTALAQAAGRSIVGVNAGGNGLSARALGATVGEEQHTMTVAEMPSHSHALVLNDYTPGSCGLWTINWNPGTLAACSTNSSPPLLGGGLQNGMTVQLSGNGAPFNVMPPSLALLYCKKS